MRQVPDAGLDLFRNCTLENVARRNDPAESLRDGLVLAITILYGVPILSIEVQPLLVERARLREVAVVDDDGQFLATAIIGLMDRIPLGSVLIVLFAGLFSRSVD